MPIYPSADPRRQAAIRRALERCGLDCGLARSVDALLDRVQDDWRVCCGSSCEPCVLPLGRAIDIARSELGISADRPLPFDPERR